MNVPMADLQAQHLALKDELTEAFDRVMATCDFGGLGENTSGLEREIAALCGAKYALGVNSGTDALLLSLLALGVGPGDEVITPPLRLLRRARRSAWPGRRRSLRILIRIRLTWTRTRRKPKSPTKTKVILPVHLFGQLADMTRFGEIARRHNVALLGDARAGYRRDSSGPAARRLGRCGNAFVLSDQKPRRLRRRRHGADGSRRHSRTP